MQLAITILVWLNTALMFCIPIVVAISLFYLVLAICNWDSEFRRHRLRRAAYLFATAAATPLFLTGFWYGALRPRMENQLISEAAKKRAENLEKTSVVKVGDSAPPILLTTIDGDELSLPIAGEVVLVNFFAAWCGPCQIELPHIQEIWDEHKSNAKFKLVVIGREENDETIRKYRDENRFTFPFAADLDGTIYSQFANASIPRTFIVGVDGKIVYSQAGFLPSDAPAIEESLLKAVAAVNKVQE